MKMPPKPLLLGGAGAGAGAGADFEVDVGGAVDDADADDWPVDGAFFVCGRGGGGGRFVVGFVVAVVVCCQLFVE